MVLERFRVDGAAALVTGAGRGIGRGIALALAEAGADVVVSARTASEIEAVAEEIRGLGRRALAVPCDVNRGEDLDRLVDRAASEFGRLDLLVNNAGGSPPTPLLELRDEAFEAAFHFNVTSALHLTRRAMPKLLESDRAAVLNISSGLGHLVEPGFVAYATAKAALSHMTRILAAEFAPRVRINALAVGATLTDALAPFLKGELRERMEALTPLRRLGTVEDIAAAALYLLSPAASWVTGKVLEVDGGTTASNWPLKIPGYPGAPYAEGAGGG